MKTCSYGQVLLEEGKKLSCCYMVIEGEFTLYKKVKFREKIINKKVLGEKELALE